MSNELFKEWEFIASIPKNAKPCFTDKTLVYLDEWFVTFKRRLKNEKAERGILYIQNLINCTKKICKNVTNKDLIKTIKELLTRSLKGLENLVYTYSSDEQKNIANEYQKCLIQISQIIRECEHRIKSRTNFFNYNPNIIN